LPPWHHDSAMLISEAYTDLAVAVKIRWRIKVLIAVKTFRLQVHKSKIQFCSACGSPTKLAVPDGDEKMRAICSSCGRVHYENPNMVVGCLVEHDNKVLLCRRKIEPAYGLW